MSFQPACPADLNPGQARAVEMTNGQGEEVTLAIICDTLGDWYAIDDLCTHGEVSLAEGDVGEACIECWAHSAEFDLVSGEGTLPATTPVRTYEVKLEDNMVLVDLDN